MTQCAAPSAAAVAARRAMKKSFQTRGILTAVSSGMVYGMYTAFMTYAMALGVWAVWYGEGSGLSEFAVLFLLSALGAGLTDGCAAIWALIMAALRGKLGDFGRSFKTRPGAMMIIAALFGGPFASTCYVVGLQMAGSIVVPISALCPAIGAILARFLFRQPLTPRMMLGILICFSASALIGFSSMGGIEARPHMMLGLLFGFLAALGWGIEGCVCGYGVSIIDSEVGITIREVTIGISNLIILVPILGWIGQTDGFAMLGKALADMDSMKWFIVAGFLCYFNFMCWYRGNAMCGAALGMACNCAYSFWGPFFCWLILGVFFGLDGWNMAPVAWVGAVLMVVGIFTIATNPLALFRRKEQ